MTVAPRRQPPDGMPGRSAASSGPSYEQTVTRTSDAATAVTKRKPGRPRSACGKKAKGARSPVVESQPVTVHTPTKPKSLGKVIAGTPKSEAATEPTASAVHCQSESSDPPSVDIQSLSPAAVDSKPSKRKASKPRKNCGSAGNGIPNVDTTPAPLRQKPPSRKRAKTSTPATPAGDSPGPSLAPQLPPRLLLAGGLYSADTKRDPAAGGKGRGKSSVTGKAPKIRQRDVLPLPLHAGAAALHR